MTIGGTDKMKGLNENFNGYLKHASEFTCVFDEFLLEVKKVEIDHDETKFVLESDNYYVLERATGVDITENGVWGKMQPAEWFAEMYVTIANEGVVEAGIKLCGKDCIVSDFTLHCKNLGMGTLLTTAHIDSDESRDGFYGMCGYCEDNTTQLKNAIYVCLKDILEKYCGMLVEFYNK